MKNKWYETENLGRCKPYMSDDEQNIVVVCEGKAIGMILDGEEFHGDIKEYAMNVNPYYDDYVDSDVHIAIDGMKDKPCIMCPYFNVCEAIDYHGEDDD